MKRFAIGVVLSLYLASAALAQGDGQLLRIISFEVELGHEAEWESALKSMRDAIGGTYPVIANQSADRPGSYTMAIPIADLNEITSQTASLNEAAAEKPELMSAVQKHVKSISTRVVQARPDLSYASSSPRVAADQARYTTAVWLSPHPAEALKAEAMLKELAKLYEKKGLKDTFSVFTQVIGADGPLYVVRLPALSEADAAAQREKNQEVLQKDFLALQQKFGPIMRSVEYRGYWTRPDLGRSGDD